MYVIITSLNRPLKTEYSGRVITFDTFESARRHLDGLIYRARYPSLLSAYRIEKITQ